MSLYCFNEHGTQLCNEVKCHVEWRMRVTLLDAVSFCARSVPDVCALTLSADCSLSLYAVDVLHSVLIASPTDSETMPTGGLSRPKHVQ
jgi:hypothetical protein